MYACRNQTDDTALQPPQDPPDSSPDLNAVPPFCCSTCPSKPPEQYGFSHTSLLAALSSIVIPNSYSQVVKHECWQHVTKKELDAL